MKRSVLTLLFLATLCSCVSYPDWKSNEDRMTSELEVPAGKIPDPIVFAAEPSQLPAEPTPAYEGDQGIGGSSWGGFYGAPFGVDNSGSLPPVRSNALTHP